MTANKGVYTIGTTTAMISAQRVDGSRHRVGGCLNVTDLNIFSLGVGDRPSLVG